MTSAISDPLIGQTLDRRYVILSRIARGGMAIVYLADDLRLERQVAIKVMHQHLAEDENFMRRFNREARSAARLSHSNLVHIFDQGYDLGHNYLVMEYLPNITLRQLLRQQGKLSLAEALEISLAVLSGLSQAHQAGIVHRDLKPENVLLADDGRIKIGDFGLARAVSANTTTGQALLGTIAYLSPELLTRDIADERSDLYAFGIMLYEMLTGEQPFSGEQPMRIAYQHANSQVPAPSGLAPAATPAIDAFVQWLTQRDPNLRPSNAGMALSALKAISANPAGDPTQLLPAYDQAAQATKSAALPGDTAALPGDTAVLSGDTGALLGEQITPSTAVLDPLEQQQLNTGNNFADHPRPEHNSAAVQLVRKISARRKKRGRFIAALITVLLCAAALIGYAFGQGPWSQVTVPEVAGKKMSAATTDLAKLDLKVKTAKCHSLKVAIGLAANVDPAPGSRLDRGSTVVLCASMGPRQLPVPTLIGLEENAAIKLIAKSGFKFGKIIDTRFDAGAAQNTVLGALDEQEQQLGQELAEQSTINLVLSAGQVPAISGKTLAEATASLQEKALVVDSALNTSVHDAEVPKDHVIALLAQNDPLRPGDKVGLQLSLGPELFPVPDVKGMGLQQAMDTLSAAGFSPSTLVPEALRGLAIASGTKPAAGSELEKGAEVRITASLSL